MLGVSVSVGAGIFSVGSKVIINQAGPAAILSFIISAIVCGFACLCYGEFTSKLPIAGSSYTFSYFSLGELAAWIIGWNILLELFMSSAVILKFWSIYLMTTFRLFGFEIQETFNFFGLEVDYAVFIGAAIFTILLIRGTKLSSRAATVFVFVKLAVIAFVVFMGLQFFNFDNLSPFIPAETVIESPNVMDQSLFSFILGQQQTVFGIFGIFSGAATIFFAYIGFDIASSSAEEVKNPRKNMPLGLGVGLLIVTILYISVAIVTVGLVSVDQFGQYQQAHPEATPSLSTAFEIIGQNSIGGVISLGAFCGLTTVVLVCMMGFSRVLFAMSRDGLFPRSISKTSKNNTPYRIQVGTGIAVALVCAFTKIDLLAEMINIGTLSAFIIVSFSIPFLRKHFKDPNNEHFKVPFGYVIPIVSGVICIWLILNLHIETWLIFLCWMSFGFLYYLIYGRKNSQLEKSPDLVANS